MKSLKLFAGLLFCTSLAFAEKPQLIVDTDMYTDYDDAGALGLLHKLADDPKPGRMAQCLEHRGQFLFLVLVESHDVLPILSLLPKRIVALMVLFV